MEIVLVVTVLAAYFAPWIIAVSRKQGNAAAIGVLNVFLGWTFIGWVIALVWAMTKSKP